MSAPQGATQPPASLANASVQPDLGAYERRSASTTSVLKSALARASSVSAMRVSTGSASDTRETATPRGAASRGYASSFASTVPSPRKTWRTSSKSWSSEAIQNTGTTGRFVARSSSAANATAVAAL